MAINDTLELALTSSLRGQVVVNTYHFRVQGITIPGGSTPEQVLVADFLAAALVAYRGFMPTDATVQTISARQVCGSLPLRVRFDQTVTANGTYSGSGDTAAPWLAILSRERTGLAGRSYQGRNFYPVGFESDFTGTALATAQRVAIDAFNAVLLAEYVTPGAAADFRLVVHSPTLAALPGNDCTESSTPVTSLQVSPYLTTLRSRRSATGA